jgi:hypothetical protein
VIAPPEMVGNGRSNHTPTNELSATKPISNKANQRTIVEYRSVIVVVSMAAKATKAIPQQRLNKGIDVH